MNLKSMSTEELMVNAAALEFVLRTTSPELFAEKGLPGDAISQWQAKAGRMISGVNLDKLKAVVKTLEDSMETLENLIGAAEPQTEEAEEPAKSAALTVDASHLLLKVKLAEQEWRS